MLRAALVVVGIAGCGRLDFELRDGDGGARGVDVTPSSASALPFTQQQLHATVRGLADQTVVWSVDAGRIDSAGIFLAPPASGDVHVVATSASDPMLSGSAVITVAQSMSPATIAGVGSIANASGMSHQVHGVWAGELGQWWLWYSTSGDPQALHAVSSADFATWQEGATLDLGRAHGDDGRNLSLASRVIAGTRVVHLSVGYHDTERGRFHVKATLDASGVTFGAPRIGNAGGATDPDGPAEVITDSGQVLDGTGWEGTPQTPPLTPCGDGDVDVYTSRELDTGTTSFDTMTFDEQVLWCVDNRTNARFFHADGETVYLLYDDGASDPDPVNLLMSVRRNDVWQPLEPVYTVPPAVFPADVTFPLDDWGATASGRSLYAVRRTDPGSATYDFATFDLDAVGSWQAGASPKSLAGQPGSGIFLAPYGIGLVAVEIGNDAAQTVAYAFWDGTSWSEWSPLTSTAAVRGAIAGIAGDATQHPAVFWTEGSGSNRLVGARLP